MDVIKNFKVLLLKKFNPHFFAIYYYLVASCISQSFKFLSLLSCFDTVLMPCAISSHMNSIYIPGWQTYGLQFAYVVSWHNNVVYTPHSIHSNVCYIVVALPRYMCGRCIPLYKVRVRFKLNSLFHLLPVSPLIFRVSMLFPRNRLYS